MAWFNSIMLAFFIGVKCMYVIGVNDIMVKPEYIVDKGQTICYKAAML